MKKSDAKVDELEIRNAFSGFGSVQKSDLRDFFVQHAQPATEQAFRRFLYGLEKRQVIIPIGAGIYAFHDYDLLPAARKKRFSPNWSQELGNLNEVVQKAFPYARYLVWETRILHEFITHQPRQNVLIVEIEKDVCESAFDHLSQLYPGRIFLEPGRVMMEKYVMRQHNSVIITRLITQSPRKIIYELPCPKLEKILVDVYVEKERFFFFQGDELAQIFDNAFASYWVNEKTLFRYASRRATSAKLKLFLQEQTGI